MTNGVLIVDDNANIRRLLRFFVETNTGFKVCGEAENGEEAIEQAKELQPDVIVLDLTLPDGNLSPEYQRTLVNWLVDQRA